MCKALVLKTLKSEGKDFLRVVVKLFSFSGIDTDFDDDLAKGRLQKNQKYFDKVKQIIQAHLFL